MRFGSLLLWLFPLSILKAQTPTWKDVAPIFYQNCSSCHRVGGIAPFPINSYASVVRRAQSIHHVTEEREMPPWPADPHYVVFKDQKLLTDQQIQLIKQWIHLGTPPGDTSRAPAPPVFNSRFVIASPDLEIKVPQYSVKTTNDLYQCFVLPSWLTADKFVTEIEVAPSDPSIVHHVLVFTDESGKAQQRDQATPGKGFPCFGGTGSLEDKLIAGWTPGSGSRKLPKGIGHKIKAGSDIIIQVHYPGGISNKIDETAVRMRLENGPQRELTFLPIINYGTQAGFLGGLENGPLFIPANTMKSFTARFDVPSILNLSILNVLPHMHLLGKEIVSYAVTPSNDTIPLVRVNNWEFHWQLTYTYQRLIHIPGGSRIYAKAIYDNTANNPENPHNPPKDVKAGEGTKDEMLLVYYGFLQYQVGDEDFLVDSTLLTSDGSLPIPEGVVSTLQLLDPSPNPASDVVQVTFYAPRQKEVESVLYDAQGRLVFKLLLDPSLGFNSFALPISHLAKGVYFLKVTDGMVVRSKKILVNFGS